MKFFLSVSSFRSNFDAKKIPKLGNKMTRDRRHLGESRRKIE